MRLATLAEKYETDKNTDHSYVESYEHHFNPFRNKVISLLEIGIGGYEDPDTGGASLRMWRDYFPRAQIHGIDCYRKNIKEERIHVHRGSQSDRFFLQDVANDMGDIHVVIDDGSHKNVDVIKSFQILFPLLASGGIYVIEDLQTAYWGSYGGAFPLDRGGPACPSSMAFLKMLVDGLNYSEFIQEGYKPTYYDKWVKSIHFYHNIVFLYKGDNSEPSNIVQNNQQPGE
jgi:hypothetical protein